MSVLHFPPAPPRSGGGGQGAAAAPNDSDTWAGREGGKGIPRNAAGSLAGGCEGGPRLAPSLCPRERGGGREGGSLAWGRGNPCPSSAGVPRSPLHPQGRKTAGSFPPPPLAPSAVSPLPSPGKWKLRVWEAGGGNERLPGSGSPCRQPPPTAACRRRTALGRPAEGAAPGPRSAGSAGPPARHVPAALLLWWRPGGGHRLPGPLGSAGLGSPAGSRRG